jgi:hypothetical protein
MRPLPFRFATALVALAAASPLARADFAVHEAALPAISPGGTASLVLPKFDPAIGVLRSMSITAGIDVAGTWAFENTTAQAGSAGGYGSPPYVGMSVGFVPPVGSQQWLAPNAAYFHSPMHFFGAFDGAVDFAGASGVSIPFLGASDGSGWQSNHYSSDFFLNAYSGPGTFTVAVGPANRITGSVPGFADGATVTATGFVRVRYDYDPFPTYVCRADGSLGCPCFTSLPFGVVGGCANSQQGHGGELAVAGTASLANDTLALLGTRMTNSSAVYFQGTSILGTPIPFGDGVRCVGGSLLRLGTTSNVGGSSQYPGPGDLSVSVRGGVGAPGLRAYQVMYRDGGAFCTPALFNATNGFVVSWGP